MSNRPIGFVLMTIGIFLVVAAVEQRNSAAHGIDGYSWESWTQDSRQLYLLTFLHAYRLGFADACLAADEMIKSQWTINGIMACQGRQMSFSRDLPDLNRAMTDFYRQYPDDRTLGLDTLLRQFSDQKHRSAQEIHGMLQSKQPL